LCHAAAQAAAIASSTTDASSPAAATLSRTSTSLACRFSLAILRRLSTSESYSDGLTSTATACPRRQRSPGHPEIPVTEIKPLARLKSTTRRVDTDCMSNRLLRLGVLGCAILLIAGLLTGCGDTAASVAGVTPPTSGPITKTQAVAYAHAVNLRSTDLPTMVPVSHEHVVTTKGVASIGRCLGHRSTIEPIAYIQGSVFGGNTASRRRGVFARINSEVAVMPSSALATRETEEGASPKYRECLIRYWRGVDEGRVTRRLTYGHVTLTVLPIALAGVHHAYGTHTTLPAIITATGAKVTRYVDSYEFTVGRADIILSVVITPSPFPISAERLLLQKMAASAKNA
jgi:hypothetical protein